MFVIIPHSIPDLYVDERCLIPRPETEILIEAVKQQVTVTRKGGCQQSFSFLDIGTGSGAIAIAILREFQNAYGTLLDISGGALDVALENLKRYKLEDRAKQVQGDLFEPFSSNEKWHLIVSNPPYLSEMDLEKAQEERAFFGGRRRIPTIKVPQQRLAGCAGFWIAFRSPQ